MVHLPHVSIKKVHFVYDDGTEALKGIDLEINHGERIGLAGVNGSGKTTLCKQMNGLLVPSAGSVTVDGVATSESDVSSLSKRVAYLFQNPDHQIFCGSVTEEISFGLKNIGLKAEAVDRRVQQYLGLLGLEEFADKPPLTLSLGLRRLVSIASTLAMEQDLAILDEPAAWLDYAQTRKAISAIKQVSDKGRTIIVVTHNMKVIAELTDRLIVMSEGKIAADGPTREILSNPDTLWAVGLVASPVSRVASKLGWNKLGRLISTPSDFVSAMRTPDGGGDAVGPR
jgi:energy-coupling factor transporter ATP-binding protein EcfA2